MAPILLSSGSAPLLLLSATYSIATYPIGCQFDTDNQYSINLTFSLIISSDVMR